MKQERHGPHEEFVYMRRKTKAQRLDIMPFMVVYAVISYLAMVSSSDSRMSLKKSYTPNSSTLSLSLLTA